MHKSEFDPVRLRRNWIAVMGAIIGAFVSILDIQITNASLKEIQGSLSATLDESSWISTAYLVAEMIVIPLSGWMCKAVGTRRVLQWLTVGFAIASVLCSLAWNLNSMIVFRALQGLAAGAMIPIAFSMIITLLPDEQRALGMTLFGITTTFAPTIGPTLGGWLTENFSWHYIFYINVPPCLLMLPMIAYGLDREPIKKELLRGADYFGILSMAIGLGALEVVLEEGNKKDWFGSELIVILSIFAAVGLIGFIINELLHEKPLVNLRLFRKMNFTINCMSITILGMSLFGAIFVLPLYMTQIHNYNALEIGLVLMWMGFPQLLVQPLLPKLTRHFDPRYLTCFGFWLVALSFFMDVHMDPSFGGEQLIPSMIVRAMGLPFIFIPLSLVITYGIPKKDVPDISTLTSVLRNLGGAVGIAAITTALQNRTRLHVQDINSTVHAVSEKAWHALEQSTQFFISHGSDPFTAKTQATALLAANIQRNAAVMAYNDVFFIMGALMVLSGAFVLLIKKPKELG